MANWDSYLNDKLKARNYSYRNDAKKDISTAIRMFEDLHPEVTYFNNLCYGCLFSSIIMVFYWYKAVRVNKSPNHSRNNDKITHQKNDQNLP